MKFILIFISTTLLSFSSNLTFEKSGDAYNIIYSESVFETDKLNLIVFEFDGINDEKLFTRPFENGKISDIILDPNHYFLFKVKSEKYEDDNYGNLWELMPSTESYPKGIYYQIALSYLGSIEYLERNINLEKAESLFNKELENYPKNVLASIALNSLQLDKRKIKFDEYSEKVKVIYTYFQELEKPNENEVKSMVRALKSIQQEDLGNQLEFNFIKDNKSTEYAEEAFIAKMAEADNSAKFFDMVQSYLKFFPNGKSKKEILSALISSEMQADKVDEIIEFIDTTSGIPAEVYAHLANRLIEFDNTGGKNDSLILAFYDKAINTQRDITFLSSNYHPYKSPENRLIYSSIIAKKANYELFIGDTVSALKSYNSVIGNREDYGNVPFYENFISAIKDTNSQKQILEQAIINSYFSDVLFSTGRKLFAEKWEETKQKWLDEAELNRLSNLKYEEIDGGSVRGFLKTTDETFTDLEHYKGSPIVLAFFSTWCGPCETMIPALEELENYILENSLNTKLFAISSWENPETRWADVYSYLNSNAVKYNVLVDETDLIPQKMNVIGLPTIIYIDQEGIISFIERGFTNQNDFIINAIDKINYLK